MNTTNTLYAVKGRTRVLTAKGYQGRMDTLGYASGTKEEIREFYKNNLYSEIDVEEIKVTQVRSNSRIEDYLKKEEGVEAA